MHQRWVNGFFRLTNQVTARWAISVQQATSLVRDYWLYRKMAVASPVIMALITKDDERRYIISDDVLIKTKQGATLSAHVTQPRNGPARQPTALFFTIYAYQDPTSNWALAKYAAAHGYVGVVAYARGKWHSPDEIRPFETEGLWAGPGTASVISLFLNVWREPKVGRVSHISETRLRNPLSGLDESSATPLSAQGAS